LNRKRKREKAYERKIVREEREFKIENDRHRAREEERIKERECE